MLTNDAAYTLMVMMVMSAVDSENYGDDSNDDDGGDDGDGELMAVIVKQ